MTEVPTGEIPEQCQPAPTGDKPLDCRGRKDKRKAEQVVNLLRFLNQQCLAGFRDYHGMPNTPASYSFTFIVWREYQMRSTSL